MREFGDREWAPDAPLFAAESGLRGTGLWVCRPPPSDAVIEGQTRHRHLKDAAGQPGR